MVGTSPLLGQTELPRETPRAVLGFLDPEKTSAEPVMTELPRKTPTAVLGFLEPEKPSAEPVSGGVVSGELSWWKPLTTHHSPLTKRIWGRGEYLLWWVKGAPLPVPIVTTGDPTVGFPALNTAGAIGERGTQVLLGNSSQHFGAFSGMRITLGTWLDSDRTVGIEGNGFALERRTSQFAAASDNTGNPPLYFPRFNPLTGAEGGVPIADPLRQFSGDVFVTQALQLWGAELNGSLLFMSASSNDTQAGCLFFTIGRLSITVLSLS